LEEELKLLFVVEEVKDRLGVVGTRDFLFDWVVVFSEEDVAASEASDIAEMEEFTRNSI
jgi:hypothetical protein